MELKRTEGDDPDFAALIALLDEELWERYPDIMQGYVASNLVDASARAVLVLEDGEARACGCIRACGDPGRAELKRMFVKKESRGRGYAKLVLRELEDWARELGFAELLLETGHRQPEAIALYENTGYKRSENYGIYAGDENSICYRKAL
jgi:putative acetyltransferase